MITLEISYLLNLREDYWKGMLTGALIIDFLALFAFTVIGSEPGESRGVVSMLFIFSAGLLSMVSSLLTIYFTRLFDRFSLGSKAPKKVRKL